MKILRILSALLILSASAICADPVVVKSLAYESSHVLLSKPGSLILIFGYNSGPAQFIQVHNATANPADGAVPLATFAVAATSNFSLALANGIPMTIGITVCNSSTGPTKTIGSADCFFTAVVK